MLHFEQKLHLKKRCVSFLKNIWTLGRMRSTSKPSIIWVVGSMISTLQHSTWNFCIYRKKRSFSDDQFGLQESITLLRGDRSFWKNNYLAVKTKCSSTRNKKVSSLQHTIVNCSFYKTEYHFYRSVIVVSKKIVEDFKGKAVKKSAETISTPNHKKTSLCWIKTRKERAVHMQ